MPVAEGISQKIIAQLIKIFSFFLFLAVFNSFLQVFVIYQCQEIKKYQSQIELLEKDISRIKVEIASLESFDRIQSIALNELGMRAAGTDDYQWIEAMPAIKDNVVDHEVDSRKMAKADLWEHLCQWIGDVGKTMAQSL